MFFAEGSIYKLKMYNMEISEPSQCIVLEKSMNIETHSNKTIQSIPNIKDQNMINIRPHSDSSFCHFLSEKSGCSYITVPYSIFTKLLHNFVIIANRN